MPAARERWLLAVEREHKLGDGAVLERTPHEARRDNGTTVVREGGGSRRGKLGHLGELVAELALADGRHEAGRHDRVLPRPLDEGAQDGRRVDDRLGVGHREDRAVPARSCGLGAGTNRLLVLAARHAQVHMRVDERRRDHERARTGRLDRADRAFGDRDAQLLVDPLRWCEHAALERERVATTVSCDEHQPTSTRSRASTGAAVRTS
jgi:hypothetical protein